MDSRTVERVRSWESVSVTDGYRGLHGLADREFSGAVVADDTWLFMLNGRVVGVFEGSIEDVEDASLDVYEAPHLSLPLLFAMQERGGETQATYYTNDTPLSETDATLADAGFTGYVELSENVLSGDYYTAYYGGRSLSAAFVGSSEELVTGDEAFERADDEVGLYEVVKVDIDVTDVPEPAEPEPEDESDVAVAGGAADETETAEPTPDAAADVDAADEPENPVQDADTDDAAVEPDASAERAVKTPEEPTADATADEPTADEPAISEAEADASAEASADADAASEPEQTADRERDPPAERPSPERPESEGVAESPSARAVDDTAAEDGVFSEEAEWRETTTVPSLDPEKAASRPSSGASSGATASQRTERKAAQQTVARRSQSNRQSASASSEQVATLKEAVAAREERIEELESRAADAESEAEELRTEVAELRDERDALRNEIEELRADLETARERAETANASATEDAAPSDRTPAEALAGTNLFVRYGSKADPTLDAVANGDASAEAVNANLRLEHHTQFDASETTVNGDPFDDFLEGTAAYRFVSWVVRDLPYELLDTGRTNGLADVFDALPDIDRAELDGTISVRDEEGEELRSTFDVVLRDRMGNPLLVAELNPERDPVTGDEMTGLVENAEVVADAQDTLGGAFYVTASFFEPDALEAAKDATDGGGFLSRSDKESYVKVARKSGFHLCLVEDRNETFHVTVPEL
ncbi:DUF7527 domain-containing protein [Salarchaeum japonicum]|uniref:Cell division protein ZapB n=1 Tax=Salarchaeum japonicum TaxID=555573 RepID=A0AAV3T4H1_9EURY|nr:hypothetical protein [Salarchaeum japonicum]